MHRLTGATHAHPGRRRRLAFAALAGGLAIVVVAQRLTPVARPPLYDGVVVTEAYRWLSPPPGQLGGAQGASGTETVQGASPVVALATPEEPPQAQIFAAPGTLVLPPGTTSLKLSIDPIPPTGAPRDGSIAGNEYRIVVATQTGATVAGEAGGNVTIVIRGPANVSNATIERFADGTWQLLPTDATGLPATFLAVVTDFGDFALVVPAAATAPPTFTSAPETSALATSAALAITGSATAESSEGGSSGVPPPQPAPLLLLGGVGAAVIVAGLLIAAWRHRRTE
ncbi:MAG: hypothetical protein ACHQ01_09685 [Candidatus Limnocylindrales bacterium]